MAKKNPVLAEIRRLLAEGRTGLEAEQDWKVHRRLVEKLEKLKIEPLAKRWAKELERGFEHYSSPTAIQAIVFEWSHANPEAIGYGFQSCKLKGKPRKILGLTMQEYTLGNSTVDCGSFDVSRITDVDADITSTEYLDYQIVKVAEVCHHAMAIVVASDAFKAVAIKKPFYVLVERHDRWPVLAHLVT